MFVFVDSHRVGTTEVKYVGGMIDDMSFPKKYVSLNEILTEPKYHGMLTMSEDFTFGYSAVGGLVFPVLEEVCELGDSFESDNVLVLEEEFSFKAMSDSILFEDDMSETMSLLSGVVPDFKEEDFKNMVVSTVSTVENIVGFSFRYNLHRQCDSDILAASNIYNSKTKSTGVTKTRSNSSNITLNMRDPEDEMYVYIPTPKYVDTALMDMDSGEFLGETVSVLEVYKAMDPYNGLVSATNSLTVKDAVKEVGEERLYGLDENNYLPIQPNEKRFYEALKRYIERSLTLYLEGKGMFSEDELARRLKENNLPEYVKVVLRSFIKAMVNVNWGHSAAVPGNEFVPPSESGDDDDDGGGSGDSATLAGVYKYEAGMSKRRLSELNYYMNSVEGVILGHLTAYGWAEAIVKLGRWGTRKPRNLVFTEEESGNDRCPMIELAMFKAVDDLSYLDSYEPELFDGRECLPLALILNDGRRFADASGYCENRDIPNGDGESITAGIIGIQCTKQYKTPSGIKHVGVYYDLLSIIDQYRAGMTPILGIDLVDKEFIISDSISLEDSVSDGSVLRLLSSSTDGGHKIVPSSSIVGCLQDQEGFSARSMQSCSLMSLLMDLTGEPDLEARIGKVGKSGSIRDKALASLAKPLLEYAFIPTQYKATLKLALETFADLVDSSPIVCPVSDGVSKVENVQTSMTMSATELFGSAKVEETPKTNATDCWTIAGSGLYFYRIATDIPVNGASTVLTTDSTVVANAGEMRDKAKSSPAIEKNLCKLVVGFERSQALSGISLTETAVEAFRNMCESKMNMTLTNYVKSKLI